MVSHVESVIAPFLLFDYGSLTSRKNRSLASDITPRAKNLVTERFAFFVGQKHSVRPSPSLYSTQALPLHTILLLSATLDHIFVCELSITHSRPYFNDLKYISFLGAALTNMPSRPQKQIWAEPRNSKVISVRLNFACVECKMIRKQLAFRQYANGAWAIDDSSQLGRVYIAVRVVA